MSCVKTGGLFFLEQYGEYCYGDAFQIGALLLLRIVWRGRDPMYWDRLHYRVSSIDNVFEDICPITDQNGAVRQTVVASGWVPLGVEGARLPG